MGQTFEGHVRFENCVDPDVAWLLAEQLGNLDALELHYSWGTHALERGDVLANEGVAYLADALRKNQSLKELSLRRCGFDIAGLAPLCEALAANSTLVELDLASVTVKLAEIRILGKMLRANSTLKALGLRDCSLTDAVVGSLAESLQGNRSLRDLGLSENKISGRGLSCILECEQELESLHFADNPLGDPGAVSLAKHLCSDRALRRLFLCRCRIGSVGARALAEALEHNKCLNSLWISGNPYDEQCDQAFLEVMEKNMHITTLQTSHAEDYQERWIAIDRLCQRNKKPPLILTVGAVEPGKVMLSTIGGRLVEVSTQGLAELGSQDRCALFHARALRALEDIHFDTEDQVLRVVLPDASLLAPSSSSAWLAETS